ncbi:hypothetical protein HPB48_005443 [Haemaphysalis longicornis]|uniref:Uncharacterized protein n=1 Tax=Haemaphysalis longicornis TaxID=44386 RepID=A0A9J6GC85_HAELO|nr:hypothetical protein HPB48_005443 [Haemaphysalis longicornis]
MSSRSSSRVRLQRRATVHSENSLVIFATVGISLHRKTSPTQDLNEFNMKLSYKALPRFFSEFRGRLQDSVYNTPPVACASSLTTYTVPEPIPSISATNAAVSSTVQFGSLALQSSYQC